MGIRRLSGSRRAENLSLLASHLHLKRSDSNVWFARSKNVFFPLARLTGLILFGFECFAIKFFFRFADFFRVFIWCLLRSACTGSYFRNCEVWTLVSIVSMCDTLGWICKDRVLLSKQIFYWCFSYWIYKFRLNYVFISQNYIFFNIIRSLISIFRFNWSLLFMYSKQMLFW